MTDGTLRGRTTLLTAGIFGVVLVFAVATVAAPGLLSNDGPSDGAANSLASAQTDDRSPSSPCLADETYLTKYEWTETSGGYEFVRDPGAPSLITVTFSNLDFGGEPQSEGPVQVDWNADGPVDVVVVQAGGGSQIEQAIELDGATTGTVTTQQGISFLAFCRETPETTTTEPPTTEPPTTEPPTTEPPTTEPPTTEPPTTEPPTTEQPTTEPPTTEPPTTETPDTPGEGEYYQVDLAQGDVIENLGEGDDDFYSDQGRLIRFLHGSSDEPVVREGDSVTLDEEIDDCVDDADIDIEDSTATATFTIPDGCALEITLASYSKPGSGWSREMADDQELIEYDTDTYGPGTYTVSVSVSD